MLTFKPAAPGEDPAVALQNNAALHQAAAIGTAFATYAHEGDAMEMAGVTLRAINRDWGTHASAVLIEADKSNFYPRTAADLRRLAAALNGVAEILEIRIPAPPPGSAVTPKENAE